MASTTRVLHEDMRTFPRKRCKWKGILKVQKTHRPCLVEDISAGGCRVAVNTKDLELRDTVVIEIESQKLRFHGELRWLRLDEAGVEFFFMD